MSTLSVIGPAWALVTFWALVGICPENWPHRWPRPRPTPPPIPSIGPGPMPPPWARALGIGGAVAAGFIFTTAVPGGVGQLASPVLEFASTGAFALAGAVGARALAAQFVPVREIDAEVPASRAFRA